MHEYHLHNFSYLCTSSVHIQQSDDDFFFDHKWRKTIFIVRGHMMIRRTDYCMVVVN